MCACVTTTTTTTTYCQVCVAGDKMHYSWGAVLVKGVFANW
jgi:formate/nitrite transporter FocA (FNT family)